MLDSVVVYNGSKSRIACEVCYHASQRQVKHQCGVTIRYDTRCYFNVRSKADVSQLNLPHGTDN